MKLRIILLNLSFLIFLSCPASRHINYQTLTKNTKQNELFMNDLKIIYELKSGINFSFIKSLESTIFVEFNFKNKEQAKKFNDSEVNIYSNNFGEIKKVKYDDSTKTVLFISYLNNREIKKRKINIDTIFVNYKEESIIKLVSKI